ncbi:MAG: YheV family putative zinc ribbon protein [Kangiellaceae bacterium]|jgi:uncharacterized metal-binding protein (TIGR02443 family)|nr:YheV family putative zinc ribbon protein [Kangiellaceae bacterium]
MNTSIRKRFIAGATCPSCSALDTLTLVETESDKTFECVACGHRQTMSDEQPQQTDSKAADSNVIQVINLD